MRTLVARELVDLIGAMVIDALDAGDALALADAAFIAGDLGVIASPATVPALLVALEAAGADGPACPQRVAGRSCTAAAGACTCAHPLLGAAVVWRTEAGELELVAETHDAPVDELADLAVELYALGLDVAVEVPLPAPVRGLVRITCRPRTEHAA